MEHGNSFDAIIRQTDAVGRLLAEAQRYGATTAPSSITTYDFGTHVTLQYDGEMPNGDVAAWQLASDQAWSVHSMPQLNSVDGVIRMVYLEYDSAKITLMIVTTEERKAQAVKVTQLRRMAGVR